MDIRTDVHYSAHTYIGEHVEILQTMKEIVLIYSNTSEIATEQRYYSKIITLSGKSSMHTLLQCNTDENCYDRISKKG